MKTSTLLGALAAIAALSSAAVAQTSPKPLGTVNTDRNGVMRTTTLFKSGKHLETVTCAQFNALDESFKPQAITYAANYGPKGKAHPTETVTGVERYRPEVVTACKGRPGDHLLDRVHAAMAAK